MTNFLTAYFANAPKRAEYRRLRNEIASLSRRDALDMGIYPEDAARIAAKAVWG